MNYPAAYVLFESSWEVCNKVGGIYTVITSKVGLMMNYYHDKEYYLVGPYFPDHVKGEFEEKEPPEIFKSIFEDLKQEGISCRFGTWNISTRPRAILIDFRHHFDKKDELKGLFWQNYQIDSLSAGYDFEEPLIWSHAVGRLIEEYQKKATQKKIVAHFHEWMAGLALLYLKSRQIDVATVFTTHATMLGRTLCSKKVNIYSMLGQINAHDASYQNNMHFKHQTEKACALASEVLTTVSEITAMEAQHFYSRKPDVLLLNGLDIGAFPTMEECSLKHSLFKSKIREFIMSYFFPYYTFNIEESLTYFIAGRNEFHVKGVDLLIDSLAQLNYRMQQEKNPKTIITFFFIPGNIKNVRHDIVENVTHFQDIKSRLNDANALIQSNILCHMLSKEEITKQSLLPKDIFDEMQKKIAKFLRPGMLPPLSTHEMYEDTDDILLNLRRVGLTNKPEDKVKVIFYPIYLTGADGLLGINYYEAMLGSHLGLFPSYYEPWGYTPLECSALGVPSVTTDLAGFGRFISKNIKDKDNSGIFVLGRKEKSWAESVDELSEIMVRYASLSRTERMQNKINAKDLTSLADWRVLIQRYLTAHNMAIERLSSER